MPGPYDSPTDLVFFWLANGQKLWLVVNPAAPEVPFAVPGRLERCANPEYLVFAEDAGTKYYVAMKRLREDAQIVNEGTIDFKPLGRFGKTDGPTAEWSMRLVIRVTSAAPSLP